MKQSFSIYTEIKKGFYIFADGIKNNKSIIWLD
jgi:hypothetical protein